MTAGCWLARRLQQLKASTTMDLGISIFLIFVRCEALRNLELLIKTGWNVFVRFVAENAGRGEATTILVDRGSSRYGVKEV